MKTNKNNKGNSLNCLSYLNLNAVMAILLDRLLEWEMCGSNLAFGTDNFKTSEEWKMLYLQFKELEERSIIFWSAAIMFDFNQFLDFLTSREEDHWFKPMKEHFKKFIEVKKERGVWWVIIDNAEVFTAKVSLKQRKATFKFSHRL